MTSISNKSNQFCISCIYCKKSYKTRNTLEKHVLLCETLYKSKNNQYSIQDEDAIPSQKNLYKIILELGSKYNRLEEKYIELSKWVTKKKKSINFLDFLNKNIKSNIIFEKLTEKIKINEELINNLFTNSFNDVFNDLLSKIMNENNQ